MRRTLSLPHAKSGITLTMQTIHFRLHWLPSALSLLLFTQGCVAAGAARSEDAFRTQQSAREARQQIADWIPLSSALDGAVKTLQSRGFTCRAMQSAAADLRSTTLCIRGSLPDVPPAQRLATPVTPVNWFVTLNSMDGTTVSNIQVSRTPKDIGG